MTGQLKRPGRPSLYEQRFCGLLIDHMSAGLSFESFAGTIDVCKDTLYEWVKAHEEFSDAKKKAFAKNQLYWEKVGIEGMYMGGQDNPFNATVWIFNMKNRFQWRDKQPGEVDVQVTQNNETKQQILSDEQMAKLVTIARGGK